MESDRRIHHPLRLEKWTALRIFGLCGLISILVDLDHFISLFIWQYINSGISEGRIWHTPLFIISSLWICYMVSHIRGLHSQLVLGIILLVMFIVLTMSPWVVWGV